MVPERLRIFTRPDRVPEACSPAQILFPWVGSSVEHDGYDAWVAAGSRFVERAEAGAAQVAVLPFSAEVLLGRGEADPALARGIAAEFVAEAASYGLKTLAIVLADESDPLPLPRESLLVLRHSLTKSRRPANEWPLPAWHDDLLAAHFGGTLPLLQREDAPRLGFCGLAATQPMPVSRRAKLLLGRVLSSLGSDLPHNDGIWLRGAAMRACREAEGIATDFIVRQAYYGGPPEAGQAERVRQRAEYAQNLARCGYALCVRGWGNYSFRFFEAMSLGRIPVLVDTDCALPLEDEIDYDRFIVRVPEAALASLPARIRDFHRRLDDAAFRGLQQEIRRIWVEQLSPLGFYAAVARRLVASGGQSLDATPS